MTGSEAKTKKLNMGTLAEIIFQSLALIWNESVERIQEGRAEQK